MTAVLEPTSEALGAQVRIEGFSIQRDGVGENTMTSFDTSGDLDLHFGGHAHGGVVTVRLDVDENFSAVISGACGGSDFTGSELYVMERARDELTLVIAEYKRMRNAR